MLTAQSDIRPLLKTLLSHFDELFRIALQCCKEQLIVFLSDVDQHADYANLESLTYCGNEPP